MVTETQAPPNPLLPAVLDKRGKLAELIRTRRGVVELGCGPARRHPDAMTVDALDFEGVDVVGDVFEVLAAMPDASVDEVHDACVAVHGAMRSRYRKDKVSMESIDRIPTQDQSTFETRKRGEMLLRTWKLLPRFEVLQGKLRPLFQASPSARRSRNSRSWPTASRSSAPSCREMRITTSSR